MEDLERLIIHNRGRKAVRGEDLAHVFGLTAEQMYRRLGRKLLLFSRSSWFEVQPEKGGTHTRPAVAFTLSGIIMVSASLRMERAIAAGMAVVPLLKTRRRSSKNRKRRACRKSEPLRQATYARVLARLQQLRMQRLLSAGSVPIPSG